MNQHYRAVIYVRPGLSIAALGLIRDELMRAKPTIYKATYSAVPGDAIIVTFRGVPDFRGLSDVSPQIVAIDIEGTVSEFEKGYGT